MTTAALKALAHKDLAQLAKQGGVRGWHSMRKDQLIKALLSIARLKGLESRKAKKPSLPVGRHNAKPARGAKPRHRQPIPSRPSTASGRKASVAARKPALSPRKATSPRVLKHLQQVKAKLAQSKDLARGMGDAVPPPLRDRVVIMVRDSYWLHVFWELTRQSVERAEAAMSQDWHTARPHLRLLEVTDGGTTSASERVIKDVEIHGGLNHWYLHLEPRARSHRVEIGYLSSNGRFYTIARSNVVTMPAPGSCEGVDEHWADVATNFDKIFAMSGGYSSDGSSTELQEIFEERLRRPMGSPMTTRYGGGLEGLLHMARDLDLRVEADLIVHGFAPPNSHVSLRGEPVRLRADGSFMVRMAMPNQRQVIPLVACSADGGQQRTVVLAVERNTKVMEPITREASD